MDFDAGDDILHAIDDPLTPLSNGPLVTATHAVFHTVDKVSAPAAVVGLQFQHSSLHTLFTNITSSVSKFNH